MVGIKTLSIVLQKKETEQGYFVAMIYGNHKLKKHGGVKGVKCGSNGKNNTIKKVTKKNGKWRSTRTSYECVNLWNELYMFSLVACVEAE